MEENTPDSIERKFMDSFGMTIDQFERLDFDEQEILIKKVIFYNRKRNKAKFKLKEIFTHYPIFAKTLKKKK